MILKALYDYYHRCGNLPQMGMELKEIGYLIVINRNGNFIRVESRMINKKQASVFNVIKTISRSGKKYTPNLFWDNYEYIIGGGSDESKKKNQTFKDLLSEYHKLLPNNEYTFAISNFYQKYENIENIIANDPLHNELKKSTKNISFLLEGSTNIAAEDNEIVAVALSTETATTKSLCSITGNMASLARLHSVIKLTKDTGALVSFQKNSGYDSYGKSQAYNSPISEEAEFAYTTALNHLLRYDSRNKFHIGNRTFVFWASNNNDVGKQAEDCIWKMFGHDSSEDDPNHGIEQVRKVFKSINDGSLKTSLDDKFYILGLAPNSARIAVTYWTEIQLKDFAQLINQHFADMEIIDLRKERRPYSGLRSILASITLGGKSSDVTLNIPDAVVKSIFQGTQYPYTLYSACIRRIRAEQKVTITRAAIIKAYLNRFDSNNKNINIMLDNENTNQGYLCGRLFAILTKIQDEANKQHSILERYLNSASATPATVFATILNLSSHHSEKLTIGRKIFFEKIKQEIFTKMDAKGFPAHLDLQDQGRFFVGYYHQIQSFFLKEKEKENEN